MSKPLISVIIPTYKREKKLSRAVKSVINQTYNNMEIIIVNDSPNKEINLNTSKNINIITNYENKGASYSRNRGILLSTGDLVAFLDDDDVWHPDKLSKQEEILGSLNSEYGFVFTGATILDESEKRKSISPDVDGHIYQEVLSGDVRIPSVTPLIRKECFAEVGIFDSSLQSSQDLDMWYRLSKFYKAKSTPLEMVEIHQSHSHRISTDYERQYRGTKKFLKKHRIEIEKIPELVGRYHTNLSIYSIYMENYSLARFHLKKAYDNSGFSVTIIIHFLLSFLPISLSTKLLHLKQQIIAKQQH